MVKKQLGAKNGYHFILKQKQVDDTFKIAEMLLNDEEDLVHKAMGWMVRAAGQTERKRLLAFFG